MKVRRAKKDEMFRCNVGHISNEALIVEGQSLTHLNGLYCLTCFEDRVIGRLSVPRVVAIPDPFAPAQAAPVEPEQEPPTEAENEQAAEDDQGSGEEEEPAAEPATDIGDGEGVPADPVGAAAD